MRALILTAIIIIIAFVVKVDLTEGSIPLTNLQTKNTEDTRPCEKQREPNYITVQTIEGDTIHSLFALHPAKVPMTFPERLQLFYQLNPHLQLQEISSGENIKLPLSFELANHCGK
ncbi:hypothetical protein MHB42_12200 [Lysinibacillus sp. FSL K6-0232]|uniref:hypothetical protein n=1 Tax=unclassified Lysinibacillus TaxID=2636778 RepID=UPI0030F98A55